MASIEMSLGWRRRREALLETLPRAARDLVRELDTLHQTVREKENCIQGLRTQITNLGGTVAGASDGTCGVVSEVEKKSIQERLSKVEGEIEAKKVAVKNLKLALDKIDITDNIDVRIQAAELEYELEREELNILNLKEESSVLMIRLQESCSPLAGALTEGSKNPVTFQELLSIPGNASIVSMISLISASVSHTPGNPPFHVTFRPPYGCVIDWATDDTRLKKGDRIVEINGEIVLGKNIDDVTKFMSTSSHLALVVARPADSVSGNRKLEKQLEEKSKENKELLIKIEKIIKEKDSLKNDNTRLSHRISYLEEQVSELQLTLQKAKDTAIITGTPNDVLTPSQPGATIIQVFQKGPQTMAVAGTEVEGSENRVHDYPTLPRLKSPSCSSYDSTSNGLAEDKGAGEAKDRDCKKAEVTSSQECSKEYETKDWVHNKRSESSQLHQPLDKLENESPSPSNQSLSSLEAKQSPRITCSPIMQGAKRTKDDLNDYHTINIKCKLDSCSSSDTAQGYQQNDNTEYDCIEKLRDRLTEKSPSYSYKSPSDFPDESRDFRTESNESSKTKRCSNSNYNSSFLDDRECHSPYNHPHKKGKEVLLDSQSPIQEEFLTFRQCSSISSGKETRYSRASNSIGHDRPSRRVVSPGAEDSRPFRPRPVPPKKPERLSLQRTTSMQSVEDTRSCSRASSASTSSRSHGHKNGIGYSSSENIFYNGDLGSSFNVGQSSEDRSSLQPRADEEESLSSTPVPSPRNFNQNTNYRNFHRHRNGHYNAKEFRRLTLSSLEPTFNVETPELISSTHSPQIPAKIPLNSTQSFTHLTMNTLQSSIQSVHSHDTLHSSNISPQNSASSPRIRTRSPTVLNGHRSCVRSKSSDASLNLAASLGLDLHEEVRAEPLYDYLRHNSNPPTNHRISRHAIQRTHDKTSFDAPPTPSTPPRGINLSMKTSSKEGEEWC